jgi:hypothetical protein
MFTHPSKIVAWNEFSDKLRDICESYSWDSGKARNDMIPEADLNSLSKFFIELETAVMTHLELEVSMAETLRTQFKLKFEPARSTFLFSVRIHQTDVYVRCELERLLILQELFGATVIGRQQKYKLPINRTINFQI